jgi:hypothetical protein
LKNIRSILVVLKTTSRRGIRDSGKPKAGIVAIESALNDFFDDRPEEAVPERKGGTTNRKNTPPKPYVFKNNFWGPPQPKPS